MNQEKKQYYENKLRSLKVRGLRKQDALIGNMLNFMASYQEDVNQLNQEIQETEKNLQQANVDNIQADKGGQERQAIHPVQAKNDEGGSGSNIDKGGRPKDNQGGPVVAKV